MIKVGVGDVLAVSTAANWAAKLINIGQVLRGLPGMNNHVVVAHHHRDGKWWGLEGRPGGVGWAPLDKYLADPRTTSNFEQPRTKEQRLSIARRAEAMIGDSYDWAAIAADAFTALNIRLLYAANWANPAPGTTPGDYRAGSPDHVVCASYAAWLYAAEGLTHPRVGQERYCYPADWTRFNMDEVWRAEARTV
jgi:hypothetical protein